MAWSELTVTNPNPTPPTNMSFTGTTAPNPPNFTKLTYADLTNWSATNPKVSPPPYYDDGSAGSLTAVAAKTAALASGSGATAGGTEGTYPGAAAGAVPASTSADPEATSLVTVVTSPGSRTECPTQQVSTMGNFTSTPNALHPSGFDVAPASAPTISGVLPAGGVSNPVRTTTTITVTGTNFRQNSYVLLDDVPQQTQYTSATELKVMNAVRKTSAGNIGVKVRTGATTTAATNWVFT